MNPVRVLVVGHAPAFVERARRALRGATGMELVGEVLLESKVTAAVRSLRPRVVLLDWRPPTPLAPDLLNDLLAEPGLAIIAVLRPTEQPLPASVVRGLGAGRLDLMRPPADESPEAAARWDRALVDLTAGIASGQWSKTTRASPRPARRARQRSARMIGIAASTGGPPALQRVLSDLPADLPVPLLLAQHMTPGFTSSLLRWLSGVTPLELLIAESGMAPLPGRVYVPPDGCDLSIGLDLRLQVGASPGLHCPSADRLFVSMAAALGADAAGVILTGMGSDGAQGLLAIHRSGGATLAQDESSSVIFGMPKAAIQAGAAGEVLPLEAIALAIRELATRTAPAGEAPGLDGASINPVSAGADEGHG
jgi:two-component system chemotaxis response regulator CheB